MKYRDSLLLCNHLKLKGYLNNLKSILEIDCDYNKISIKEISKREKFFKKLCFDEYKYKNFFFNNFTFKKYFDIVIIYTPNNVFNHLKLFETVHKIVKPNGIMIYVCSIQFGFDKFLVNYHPKLFSSLSFFNDYKIIAQFILKDKKRNSLPLLFEKHFIRNIYCEEDSLLKELLIMYFIFQKKYNNKFISPISLDFYNKYNNKNSSLRKKYYLKYLKNKINLLKNIENIAIFGTEKAAIKAYYFLKYFKFNILCFIDDYKSGFFLDTKIPIINRDIFHENYANKVDAVVFGPYQKCKSPNFKKIVKLDFEIDEDLLKK